MMSQSDQNSGIKRVCTGCGATAGGLWPNGWCIVPIKQAFAGVVGERVYCPACQGTPGKVER